MMTSKVANQKYFPMAWNMSMKYAFIVQLLRFQDLLVIICVCVLVTQSCLTLCDPMDASLPGSSVHGILQAKILESLPSPGDLPDPRTELSSPALQADSWTI